ncbi:MAG: GNAT family N-acetyltransferase [Ilumatobacteraceae bacterium]
MFVRPFAPPHDTAPLYFVCLRTADAGRDATHLHGDPALPGHVWLGAYLVLQPDLAWVVDDGDGRPVGYVVGTADTTAFQELCERAWWPRLRERFPAGGSSSATSADQELVRLIHDPPSTPAAVVATHPSHLHIDLLPESQGAGIGRVLMETLFAALAERGSTGVSVGVDATNAHALGFYRHLGFVDLATSTGAVWLGRALD